MRPPVDGITRTKPIRVMVTPEILDALQQLAGLDNVPAPFKAYQILKQYVADNQWILKERETFMQNLQQQSRQREMTVRQPIKIEQRS